MRIAIWKTGHEIADTVAKALSEGFGAGIYDIVYDDDIWPDASCCIGYGILRGMEKKFFECDEANIKWFNVDRGYFKPGHYDGFYRISHRGTQAIWHENAPSQRDNFNLQPFKASGDFILICPPTDYVCDFFNINYSDWCNSALAQCDKLGLPYIIRNKQDSRPLAEMLDKARAVITFNSSVGWEAVRLGLPVLSDVTHSTVGSFYGKKTLEQALSDYASYDRELLFSFMRAHQFTLSEIKAGKAWPLIRHYMCSSDLTAEKPSPHQSPLTALPAEPLRNWISNISNTAS